MRTRRRRENGSGLMVVILVVALLAGIGVPLLMLTSMGPKISGSVRTHEEAFNAAEAGVEKARIFLENQLSDRTWTSFTDHYLLQPTGIGLPIDASGNPNPPYFQRKTDAELLQSFDPDGDGLANVANLLAFNDLYATDEKGEVDRRLAFTAFLIDDEGGGGASDPTDALLVVIGTVRSGSRLIDSVRLEVLIGYNAF
jgi:hypothetical protein